MQTIREYLQNDSFRIIVGLFIQIAFSYPLRSISSTNIRKIYSFVLGTTLQVMVFGPQAFIILNIGIAMFFVTKFFGKKSGGIVTFLAMVILSCYHLHGLIYFYGQNKMDEVVLLMTMVCKYSLFAYGYADGHQTQQKGKQQSIVEKKKQFWITNEVNLFDYVCYLQFLPTSLMGPPIEFKIYENFILDKGIFENQIPSRKSVLLQTFKQFLGCLVLFAAGVYLFPPSYMTQPQFIESNVLYVFFYSVISITLMRFKYYSGWKVGILSVHSSGISYNPASHDFTNIDHCKVVKVQTTPHIRQKISNWNIMVQQWLRKCIYERSPFKSRFLSQLFVFMVSAFWHGFYIGYYFSFFLWFAQVYVQGQIFKISKNENGQFYKIYKKLGNFSLFWVILSSLLFSHNGAFFSILQQQICFKLLAKVYYIPQMLIILSIIVLAALPEKKKSRKAT